MSEHTPGPWNVELPFGEEGLYISAPNTQLVAKVYEVSLKQWVKDKQTSELANARLIAAAPEMYEALRWLYNCRGSSAPHEVREAVEQVLAKIDGQKEGEL